MYQRLSVVLLVLATVSGLTAAEECDVLKLQDCVLGLSSIDFKANNEEMCSKVLTGADCLEDLQERCPEGEGDNITSTVVTTLNSLNIIITSYCKACNLWEMQKCTNLTEGVESDPPEVVCPKLLRGIRCMEALEGKCEPGQVKTSVTNTKASYETERQSRCSQYTHHPTTVRSVSNPETSPASHTGPTDPHTTHSWHTGTTDHYNTTSGNCTKQRIDNCLWTVQYGNDLKAQCLALNNTHKCVWWVYSYCANNTFIVNAVAQAKQYLKNKEHTCDLYGYYKGGESASPIPTAAHTTPSYCSTKSVDACVWSVFHDNEMRIQCRSIKSAKDCMKRINQTCYYNHEIYNYNVKYIYGRMDSKERDCKQYGYDTGYGYMTTTHRSTADPYKQCTVDKIDNCAWKVLYGYSLEDKCRDVRSAKDCFRRLDYNCDYPTQKHLGDVESRVNIMEAQCHMYGHDTGYGSHTGDGDHRGSSGVSTHHAMGGILVFTLSIVCAIFWN